MRCACVQWIRFLVIFFSVFSLFSTFFYFCQQKQAKQCECWSVFLRVRIVYGAMLIDPMKTDFDHNRMMHNLKPNKWLSLFLCVCVGLFVDCSICSISVYIVYMWPLLLCNVNKWARLKWNAPNSIHALNTKCFLNIFVYPDNVFQSLHASY